MEINLNNKEIAQLFNTVESVDIFPMLDTIYLLSVNFPEAFKEPLKAIYRKLSLKPLLMENMEYFKEKDYVSFSFPQITSLEQLDLLKLEDKENIIDKDHNVILFSHEIKHSEKYLSLEPFINYIILDFIRDLVDNSLNSVLKYGKDLQAEDLSQYLTLKGKEIEDLGYIEEIFNPILEAIFEIVGKHPWNIYYVEFNNTDLVLKRSVDYRILDWMVRYEGK